MSIAQPTGLNSPAHTGKAVTPTSPIPAGAIGGPLAPKAPAPDPLAAILAQAQSLYGPSQMANYPQAFQGALDHARGSITQMLQGSLGDIANSQAKAEQALGQYAPMVNTAWNEGQGNIQNGVAASQGALAQYGMGSGSGLAAANMAPELAAMKATHANDLADQSLLNTGIQQEAAHNTAQAHLAANDRMGQLDQLQAQLQNQAAMAAQAHQWGREDALQNFNLGLLSHQQDFQDQQKLAAANATSNTNPATGIYASSGLTQGQLDSAHKLPQYGRFNSMVTGLKAGTPEANIAAGQILQATANNPGLQQVLIAENQDLFKTATPVNQQPQDTTNNNTPYQNPLLNYIANDNSLTGRVLKNAGPNGVISGNFGRGLKRIGSWF